MQIITSASSSHVDFTITLECGKPRITVLTRWKLSPLNVTGPQISLMKARFVKYAPRRQGHLSKPAKYIFRAREDSIARAQWWHVSERNLFLWTSRLPLSGHHFTCSWFSATAVFSTISSPQDISRVFRRMNMITSHKRIIFIELEEGKCTLHSLIWIIDSLIRVIHLFSRIISSSVRNIHSFTG